MIRRVLSAVLAVTFMLNVVACAQRPHAIPAENVQSTVYYGLQCNDMVAERSRVETQLSDVSDAQDSAASTDTALFWVGFLLFWPAWFGWAATDDHQDEIARLKGEKNAIDAAYSSRCMGEQPTPAASM